MLLCLGFIVRTNWIRGQRILAVSQLSEWSVDEPLVSESGPTGYADGKRRLILPGHNYECYQWIAQTQQMLAQNDWRVRWVDNENAPTGHEVLAPSPYRWWLGLLAACDRAVSGRPLGQSVERVVLWADPLLHGLLLMAVTLCVGRFFGAIPAAAAAIGVTTLFPFAAGFLSGAPHSTGAIRVCVVGSVLLLAAGASAGALRRARWTFFGAGLLGGLGLWLSVVHQLPVLAGVVVGGIGAAAINRRNPTLPIFRNKGLSPWRMWALGGAGMSLVGYLAEFFPGHMTMRLELNHPLYALAFLGAGELLAQVTGRLSGQKLGWSRSDGLLTGIAAAALALLPVVLILRGTQLTAPESVRLLRLSLSLDLAAQNVGSWISRDGFTSVVWATFLPLITALVAGMILASGLGGSKRSAVVLTLGPVVVVTILAFRQLWWWNLLDAVLLGLLVSVTAAVMNVAKRPLFLWAWSAVVLALAVPGLLQLWASAPKAVQEIVLTDDEGESYIERDLAHWLYNQTGPERALVLASPNLTTTLCFHGGLRGLGTLSWENQAGTAASVRLVSALSTEEALALVNARGLTHIVIPSWDSVLDEYAQLGLRAPVGSESYEQSFLSQLHHWQLPLWLRPVPYPLPPTAGAERSVVILQVVEEQEPPLALSRLADYFVEMRQLERAVAIAQDLRQFPGDLNALTAIAQVEASRGDAAASTAVFNRLSPYIARGSRRALPVDRRLSLAILLAQQKRADLAKEQVERCLADLDAARLRSLTTVSLYRLHLLMKRYELTIADPQLRELARSLLRPELRARL